MTRFALALMPLLAVAQPAAACSPLIEVLDKYRAEYGETLQWMGNSFDPSKGDTLVLISAPNGSWTLFRTDGETACQVDFGIQSKNLLGSGV